MPETKSVSPNLIFDTIENNFPIYVLDKTVTPSYEEVKGIIEPTVCTLHQERIGAYEVYMEYIPPNLIAQETGIELSENDKNRLRVFSVLKVPLKYRDTLKYQLFRINKVSKQMTSDGFMRETAQAPHIFYDLKYKILPDPGFTGTGLSGTDYTGWADNVLKNIMSKVLSTEPVETRFTYSCDMTGPLNTICFDQREQINLVKALLDGSESFIGRCGDKARLYRDNFRFSINDGTENSVDIGTIRYSENMTSIDYSEDWSEVYTHIDATDNYGHVSRWIFPDLEDILPQPIQKRIKLQYPEHIGEKTAKSEFDRDVKLYYERHSQPKIHIKITFANIENNILYADFLGLRNYEVGDKLSIYHEGLGISINGLEIISKDYDVLEQKTTEIEIGEFLADGVHEDFYSSTITEV